VVYNGIGLSLWRLRREEYIKASFKGCWKHSQCIWVLVDMHSPAPWENKLMYPPVLKDQRKEPSMTARLSTLVNRVVELHRAGLEACHYVEEFHLQRIRPLGRREKLAYECPRLVDPSRFPVEGEILTSFYYCTKTLFLSNLIFCPMQLCPGRTLMGSRPACLIRACQRHVLITYRFN
jgi:hypothetical protein